MYLKYLQLAPKYVVCLLIKQNYIFSGMNLDYLKYNVVMLITVKSTYTNDFE